MNSINFIEAVRANTQRAYSYQSQGTGFNEILTKFESTEFIGSDKEFTFIEKWMKQFGIGNKLSVQQNSDGLGNQVFIDNKPLADNGYGITQFLPVLMKIALVARKNREMFMIDLQLHSEYGFHPSILIIEEPETNLHPRLQSLLADMFVDAAKKFHIQFIIETHSEYLIRKLQYLTANKEHEYNLKPEDTVIYYFNDPKTLQKGEAQVKEIRIDEFGGLSDSFGKGFYDEATSLKFQLINLNKKQYN